MRKMVTKSNKTYLKCLRASNTVKVKYYSVKLFFNVKLKMIVECQIENVNLFPFDDGKFRFLGEKKKNKEKTFGLVCVS